MKRTSWRAQNHRGRGVDPADDAMSSLDFLPENGWSLVQTTTRAVDHRLPHSLGMYRPSAADSQRGDDRADQRQHRIDGEEDRDDAGVEEEEIVQRANHESMIPGQHV